MVLTLRRAPYSDTFMIRDNICPTDYVNCQTALTYMHVRLQATLCLTDGVKNQKASTHTFFLQLKPVSGLKETAPFQYSLNL
jgi:hypothetical protein